MCTACIAAIACHGLGACCTHCVSPFVLSCPAVAGFMPAKTTLFTDKCVAKFDLGKRCWLLAARRAVPALWSACCAQRAPLRRKVAIPGCTCTPECGAWCNSLRLTRIAAHVP